MIARLFPAAKRLVDLGVDQPVGRRRAQQQMVDAEARVARPGTGLIVPIGPHAPGRMAGQDRIGPAVALIVRLSNVSSGDDDREGRDL